MNCQYNNSSENCFGRVAYIKHTLEEIILEGHTKVSVEL